jgi:hypothetical protein
MNANKKYFYCRPSCIGKIIITMSLILLSSVYFAKPVISVQGIGPEMVPRIEPPRVSIPDNKMLSTTQDIQTADQQITDPAKETALTETPTDESSDIHTSHGHHPHNSNTETNQELASSPYIDSGSTSSFSFIPTILIFAAIFVFIIVIWIVVIKRFRKAIESRHNIYNNKNRSQSHL